MSRPRSRLRGAENIVPVSELKARAYGELTERAGFVAAVAEGRADADAGRTHSHAEFRAEMARRFGEKSR